MTLETIAPLSDDPIISLPALLSVTNAAHAGEPSDHAVCYTAPKGHVVSIRAPSLTGKESCTCRCDYSIFIPGCGTR